MALRFAADAHCVLCASTVKEGAAGGHDRHGRGIVQGEVDWMVDDHVTGEAANAMCFDQPLAVRYKDFHRNIKKHYAKLLKVLQGYALSCTNVRLSVVNTSGKAGGRQVVLATQAHQRTGDNIASVFGTKFFRTLVPVEFVLDDAWPSDDLDAKRPKRGGASSDEDSDGEERKEEEEQESPVRSTPAKKATRERQVVGYVSKVGAGVGRSDNDRQFFFINGRPFDLPKVRLRRSVSGEGFAVLTNPDSCVCADREGYQRSLAPIRDEAKARVRPELFASARRL